MAQKKSLDAAIDELLKDYKTAITKSVEYASDRAVEDIWKYSLSCLEAYYDNYDPNRYDRTDSLWHAFVPYLKIKNNSKSITSTVGVEYDASVLDAYISSNDAYNGSKKYRPVDASWVIQNYLEGVHPATDGSSIPGGAIYFEIRDPVSPAQKMEQYLNDYIKTFDSNLLISLAAQVAKKMQ